jgi:hypothetical protein
VCLPQIQPNGQISIPEDSKDEFIGLELSYDVTFNPLNLPYLPQDRLEISTHRDTNIQRYWLGGGGNCEKIVENWSTGNLHKTTTTNKQCHGLSKAYSHKNGDKKRALLLMAERQTDRQR